MRLLRALLILTLPALSGCNVGLLYTHTWTPLTTNFDRTPMFHSKTETGASDVKDLQIPAPYHWLEFKWHVNAIGAIAKLEDLDEIYYADMEHFSVALGIWSQNTVHVYGRAKATPKTTPTPVPPDVEKK
jgi:hypothetical protein